MRIIAAAIMLFAVEASAQLYFERTSDVLDLNPLTGAIEVDTNRFAIIATINAGGDPVDLTGVTFQYSVTDRTSGTNVAIITGAVYNATSSVVFVSVPALPEGNYLGTAIAVMIDTSMNYQAMTHYITAQNPASGGSASVTVNQTNINNITIDNSTTITGVAGVVTVPTNAYAAPVTNSGVVTVYIPTNSGSGSGGALTILDYTNQTFSATTQIQFGVEFKITTNAYGVYITRTDVGAFPTNFTGTNLTTYAPNWSTLLGGSTPTNLYHVFSATTTQAIIKIWSAASVGGCGYTEYVMAHPTLMKLATLDIMVGQGGYAKSNEVAGVLQYIAGGWPNGGAALSRSNGTARAGAGRSQVKFLGGDILAVAGAPSGHSTTHGGGLLGLAGSGLFSSAAGDRGTQTNGGARGFTSHATYLWTNTAGGYLQAGEPGYATNNTSATLVCNGAGDGYYAGGGGIASGNTTGEGGSGSGWINATNACFVSGYTQRGVSQTVAINNEELNYIAGRGIGSNPTQNTYAGHGLVLVYER